MTSTCLQAINPNLDLPKALPSAMSLRFRIATNIANALKDAGYSAEVGYDQFLYPNEKDTRKMLLYLVEQIPKTSAEEVEEVLGAGALLRRNVLGSVKAWASPAKAAWTPWAAHRDALPLRGEGAARFRATPVRNAVVVGGSKQEQEAEGVYVDSGALRPSPLQVAPKGRFQASLLERNSNAMTLDAEREVLWGGDELSSQSEQRKAKQAGIAKLVASALRGAAKSGSASQKANSFDALMASYASEGRTKGSIFTHKTDFEGTAADSAAGVVGETKEKEPDAEEVAAKRAEELERLQERLDAMQREIGKLTTTTQNAVSDTRQAEGELLKAGEQTEGLEEVYSAKKRTFDLLPELEKNMAALRKLSASTAADLMELGKEWEKRRAPIVAHYRTIKEAVTNRKAECKAKLEQIKVMRAEMKQNIANIRERDGQIQQLEAEYAKMPKNVDRAQYTRRITDIVRNVKKQNAEISKILLDSRTLRKEINLATEALERSYTATDELVFQEAKKSEPTAKVAYKSLVELHEMFAGLTKAVNETGTFLNNTRDMESKIDALQARNTSLNMDKIAKDLKQIKSENAALMAKIKGKA